MNLFFKLIPDLGMPVYIYKKEVEQSYLSEDNSRHSPFITRRLITLS